MVIILPSHTHPGADVFDASLRRHIGKGGVAVVLIEVVAPEVIGHIEVRIAIVIVVTPGAGKAEAVVVLVEPGGLGDVGEGAITIVAVKVVGGTVLGVVVGRGVGDGLVVATVLKLVGGSVEIEPAVAIVVSRAGRCAQSPLGKTRRPPDCETAGAHPTGAAAGQDHRHCHNRRTRGQRCGRGHQRRRPRQYQ